MEQAGGLLLPLFFVVTGLTVNIGALNGGERSSCWWSSSPAPCSGRSDPRTGPRARRLDRRQSATIAALVNTRGLTELIALNVGLSAGLIHQRLFTILVLMALITTIATGPLISAIGRPEGDQGVSPRLREETAHADVDDGS